MKVVHNRPPAVNTIQKISQPLVLVGLVLPFGIAVATLLAIAVLIPFAPESLTMQWSTSGESSRQSSPFELFILPFIGLALSLTIWFTLPAAKPSDARWAIIIGTAINGCMSGVAITLLAGQMTAEPSKSLPTVGIFVGLFSALIIGALSCFLLRKSANAGRYPSDTNRR